MDKKEIQIQNLQNRIISLTKLQTNIQASTTAQVSNLQNLIDDAQAEITKLQTPEVVNTTNETTTNEAVK